MRKVSLIFPMAGEGARFGYRFKPFLDVHGTSFIEAAFAPFYPWRNRIDRIVFAFTRMQEEAHGVSARLSEMFAGLPIETAILDAPTRGPAETVQRAVEARAVAGRAIVCDCDHAVDVDELMRVATMGSAACAVPTWSLAGETLTAWSVAAIDPWGCIQAIREKALPEPGEAFRGVIGCYYFADIAGVAHIAARDRLIYLSDIVGRIVESGAPVLSVPIDHAEFFGDPARLARVGDGVAPHWARPA